MFDLDRTGPASRDLDWLPRELKVARWTVAGAIGAASTAGAAAVSVVTLGHLAHVAAIAAAGGFIAGNAAAQALVRERLRRLARGIDLASIAGRADGELVHVRGRVQARAPLGSLLHGAPCVFRRVTFRLGGRMIHEAAVDFDLVDEQGDPVRVCVDGARLLAPAVELTDYPAARFTAPDAAPSLHGLREAKAALLRAGDSVPAGEFVLRHGDEVEVVGWKARVVDVTATAMARETPMRPALRSGRALPLLVTPIGREGPTEL